MARAMKDSGIVWVGEIPKEWSSEKVKYHFQNTKYIPGSRSTEYERLALTLKGVIKREKEDANGLQPKDFDTYQLLRKNELVFKLIDLQNVSTSRVGLSPYTGLVSPAYIILRASGSILPSFAEKYFLMLWHREIFNALGDNGVRSNLGSSDLLNIPICCPTIDMQHRITIFIDEKCAEIDALIADVQAQIETLEQYKRSVITETVTKGLNPNVPMKDSHVPWIGRIPETWGVDNPKWHFIERKDRAYPGLVQLTASQKYGVITQEEYMQRTGARVVVVQKDFDILKLVCPGDFVIHMRSFQGGLEYSELKGSTSSAYIMLIPKATILEPRYYRWFFKSDIYIDALSSTTNLVRDGQAMRWANFIQLPILFPSKEEQQAIASYLDAKCAEIDAIIDGKRQQLAVLAEYKKSIIFEYVTGKKEVPVA